MKYFISRDDKNIAYQDFKTLLEEIFPGYLVIRDYKELEQYELPLFPAEAVFIYYSEEMNQHYKFHHLVYNTRCVVFITPGSLEQLEALLYTITQKSCGILPIGLNKEFIQLFSNTIFKYLRKKHKLPSTIYDTNKDLINKLILVNKTSILRFCKTLFFTDNIEQTLEYLKKIDIKQDILKKAPSETPFMWFYKEMMKSYRGITKETPLQILLTIIIWNRLY